MKTCLCNNDNAGLGVFCVAISNRPQSHFEKALYDRFQGLHIEAPLPSADSRLALWPTLLRSLLTDSSAAQMEDLRIQLASIGITSVRTMLQLVNTMRGRLYKKSMKQPDLTDMVSDTELLEEFITLVSHDSEEQFLDTLFQL